MYGKGEEGLLTEDGWRDECTYLFLTFQRSYLLALTRKFPIRTWFAFHVRSGLFDSGKLFSV